MLPAPVRQKISNTFLLEDIFSNSCIRIRKKLVTSQPRRNNTYKGISRAHSPVNTFIWVTKDVSYPWPIAEACKGVGLLKTTGGDGGTSKRMQGGLASGFPSMVFFLGDHNRHWCPPMIPKMLHTHTSPGTRQSPRHDTTQPHTTPAHCSVFRA